MYIVGGLAELRTKFVDETCEQAVYDAVDAWKKSAPAALTNSTTWGISATRAV